MKHCASGKWHCWEGNNGILLSDENTKTLRSFKTIDDAINWLYLTEGDKVAARAINKAFKGVWK